MGPSKKEAYEDADKAFEEIYTLLKTKYNIADPEELLWVCDDNGKRTGERRMFKGFFHGDCVKAKKKLKRALRDVFWSDACDGF